jgi:predicted lipoprotein with Yx(FWY)xxD motif
METQEACVMRLNHGSRRPALPTIALAALLLTACGRGNGGTSSGGGSPSPSGTALSVQTDSVSGVGTVLANSAGLTLYHNSKETGSRIVCTGGCASFWPPVLVTGSLPQETGMVKGTFGTIMRPDGSTQLTINGMPLYTYRGDSGSGQASGQGIEGVWFAVTPSGTSTSTGERDGAAGGGGGYGGYGS